MLSRAEMGKAAHELVGSAHLARDNRQHSIADSFEREAEDMFLDLTRLRDVPESKDTLEEYHLRFLARLRLLAIDEYRIVGFIGAGRCGVVYRAIRGSNPEPDTALKILFVPRNEEELERFIQEGNILSKLDHPSIVKGFSTTNAVPFMPIHWYPMELVTECDTLERVIERRDMKGVLNALASACEALAYAHDKGIVHRDLHADNILVLHAGGIKILDFGAAKFGVSLATFKPLGSLKTSAPEKFVDPHSVSGASDIFSIGCILYFALYDRWPFFSETYRDYVNRLTECSFELPETKPAAIRDVIRTILVSDPQRRPIARELAGQMRHLASVVSQESRTMEG